MNRHTPDEGCRSKRPKRVDNKTDDSISIYIIDVNISEYIYIYIHATCVKYKYEIWYIYGVSNYRECVW